MEPFDKSSDHGRELVCETLPLFEERSKSQEHTDRFDNIENPRKSEKNEETVS